MRTVLAVLCIAAAGASSARPAAGEGARTLAVCITRHDNIHNRLSTEILVIGRISAGVYTPVREDDFTSPGDSGSSRRVALMKAGRHFDVFRRGGLAGSLSVTSVALKEFDCSSLFIGMTNAALPVDTSGPAHSISGGHETEDFDYSLTYRLALSAPPGPVMRETPVPVVVAQRDTEVVKALASSCLAGGKGRTAPVDIRFKTLEFRSIGPAGTTVGIFTAVGGNRHGSRSVSGVVSIRAGGIDTLLLVSEENEAGSWGEGHEFLDALDLDGDGVPELVFVVNGYESTGFEVYKLKNGRFRKVMEIDAWGC
jgi:hypothetical protein